MLINGQEHEITFEEAVKWHREMWNWIAEQEDGTKVKGTNRIHRGILKMMWCDEHRFECVESNCFLCEYTEALTDCDGICDCRQCPLDWSFVPFDMYRATCHSGEAGYNWKVSDAKSIANLPLKKDLLELSRDIHSL